MANRDFYHYPLTIQAVPGSELDLRVQYRADVFDEATIAGLVEHFTRVLVAMITDPAQPLLSTGLPRGEEPPTPPDESQAGTDCYRAPANHVEEVLAAIFARALGVDRVGADHSFFDLGGDSLSAMRAVTAINIAFGRELPVTTLFDCPTVGQLSLAVTGD